MTPPPALAIDTPGPVPAAETGGSVSEPAPGLPPRPPLEALGQRRDEARLLVAARASGRLDGARMADLPRFLSAGDVVVVNTSSTLPAAVVVDDDLVVHLSTELVPPAPAVPAGGAPQVSTWVVELRHLAGHGSTPRLGHRPTAPLDLPGGAVLDVLEPYAPGGRAAPREATRLWTAQLSLPPATVGTATAAGRTETVGYLAHHGRPIRYGAGARAWPLDAYQTVFATEPGSAEMPSAGRGFTAEVVTDLVRHGITVAPIVLHTGVASQEAGEPPYPERYRVPAGTAAAVNSAHATGGRVVAVGTTATRAIETVAGRNGGVLPGAGWTDLVITPERGVRAVDGLITGWHDPEASHLLLVEAIAGRELLDRSYDAAVATGYHGHEFGDFHLILP